MKKFLCVFLCLSFMLGIMPAFATGVSPVMQVANCNSYVSLREYADSKSTRLVKVHLGELVTKCESASNGFVKCVFDGQTGYILEKYLKTTSEPSDAKVLPNQQVTKCTSWVSLRKDADTSSARLAKVPLGATVKGCVLVGNFVKCSYGGQTGYILAKYLKNASSSTAPAAEGITGEARVVNCASFVSLRKTPDTSAPRLDKVPLGAYVIAKGSASNGFIKAEYKGQEGYILSTYLKKSNTGNIALADQRVTGCESWVSLRESPSTSAFRLDKVPLGATVTDCVKNGSFVKCTYKGQTGYILAKYLKNA
ncbi:MAG: SH3 domain-containing protein [Clostridia bacterium]|nr:SH3 domain-containing protein [Clostridia bacterium]